MSKRNWLGLAVKVLLTVGLFWLILHNCDWAVLRQRLAALPTGALVVILTIIAGQLVLLSLRWCWITDCMGFRLSMRDGLAGQLISQFFNQGLPSSLGGDGVRIWWLMRICLPLEQALENVLFDRLAGFLSLLLLCQLSLCLLVGMTESVTAVYGLAVVSGAGLAGLVILLLPWRLIAGQAGPQDDSGADHPGVGRRWIAKPLRWIADFRRLVLLVCRSPRACTRVLGSSLCIHLLSVFLAYFTAVELGVTVSFIQCLATVVPALLVAYLPVSIAGWGVREGAMVVAFGMIGVPATDAVVVSLTLGLGYLAVALCGGLVWLVGGFGRVVGKLPSSSV
jgi:uncharacterized membrane protein YbhN (UPF0104 family)